MVGLSYGCVVVVLWLGCGCVVVVLLWCVVVVKVGVHGISISFSAQYKSYSATYLPEVCPEQGTQA